MYIPLCARLPLGELEHVDPRAAATAAAFDTAAAAAAAPPAHLQTAHTSRAASCRASVTYLSRIGHESADP